MVWSPTRNSISDAPAGVVAAPPEAASAGFGFSFFFASLIPPQTV